MTFFKVNRFVFFSKLVFIVLTVLLSTTETSIAQSNNVSYWLESAEQACIYDRGYTVHIETEVYTNQGTQKTSGVSNTGQLFERSNSQLQYTVDDGLRKASSSQSVGKMGPSAETSSFILDISSMLKKMQGSATWILENDHVVFNNIECAVISSSGESWVVRLWISKTNGAVVRYDQYLNGKSIGTSVISYDREINGKYYPSEATTLFHITRHHFIQRFTNYNFN